MENVVQWLKTFELSKQFKDINRDFSDAVLVAEILKQLYPKSVELHNYPPRNSLTLKRDNWNTLNRKVLRKLSLHQSADSLQRLCQAVPGAIEQLFHDIKDKWHADQEAIKLGIKEAEEPNENSDIMNVSVEKKLGNGNTELVTQKMVTFALYSKLRSTELEQRQAIAILTQKIEHLDNLLKLKCQRIDDLQSQLARKSRRLKIESDMFPSITEDKAQQLVGDGDFLTSRSNLY